MREGVCTCISRTHGGEQRSESNLVTRPPDTHIKRERARHTYKGAYIQKTILSHTNP
jgi:hypothetical protein